MADKSGLKPSQSVRGSVKIGGGIGQVATFLGRRPPTEIKNLVDVLPKTPEVVLGRIVKFVVEYIKGTQITEEQWGKLLISSKGFDEKDCRLVFSGCLMLIKVASRDRVPFATFVQDLEALTILGAQNTALVNALKEVRKSVQGKEPTVTFPHLVSLDYRVDVTITTSEMDRVLKPTILMRVTDSCGDIRTMELNPEQFHKLRFAVARVLKEFETLDATPILKIDRDS